MLYIHKPTRILFKYNFPYNFPTFQFKSFREMISLRSVPHESICIRRQIYIYCTYVSITQTSVSVHGRRHLGKTHKIYIIYNRLVTTSSSFIYIYLVNIILCSSQFSNIPSCVKGAFIILNIYIQQWSLYHM